MNQEKWKHFCEWPLVIAAGVFLIAYSWEIIANLDGTGLVIAESIIWITWIIFVVDYVANLILAKKKFRWFYNHLFDLAVVALPMLRPFRLLRLVTILGAVQAVASGAFRRRIILYVAGASALLVYIAALAMVDVERSEGGRITTLGEGLWWALVTITTVGYGDYFPVTAAGQVVAVGVMIAGIALIGVVTATLASWIVEKVSEEVEQEETEHEKITAAHIHHLTQEIAALRLLITNTHAGPGGAVSGSPRGPQ